MNCAESEVLLHALIDGELDAGHAREVEAHIATCYKCAAAARDYRKMKKAFAQDGLRYTAPPGLRRRIEASLPQRSRAEPARGAARFCAGLRGVGNRRNRACRGGPAQ